ncbi:hypothetical protein [Treponema endosymbiont of Eucomonympha sp.]|uniref:hypothetical protein n=1 Tax=Treponema endosymbiont of Eucomonympha sp. TaxID=1580831 RepID=UPI000A31E99C|nr:hypothetical protein [Treponema endosymbiont of Eucomonympha sp.]
MKEAVSFAELVVISHQRLAVKPVRSCSELLIDNTAFGLRRAPEFFEEIRHIGRQRAKSVTLFMDRAYESNETREFAKALGFNPVVPPKRNYKTVELRRKLYKERNGIDRFFRLF